MKTIRAAIQQVFTSDETLAGMFPHGCYFQRSQLPLDENPVVVADISNAFSVYHTTSLHLTTFAVQISVWDSNPESLANEVDAIKRAFNWQSITPQDTDIVGQVVRCELVNEMELDVSVSEQGYALQFEMEIEFTLGTY